MPLAKGNPVWNTQSSGMNLGENGVSGSGEFQSNSMHGTVWEPGRVVFACHGSWRRDMQLFICSLKGSPMSSVTVAPGQAPDPVGTPCSDAPEPGGAALLSLLDALRPPAQPQSHGFFPERIESLQRYPEHVVGLVVRPESFAKKAFFRICSPNGFHARTALFPTPRRLDRGRIVLRRGGTARPTQGVKATPLAARGLSRAKGPKSWQPGAAPQ